MGEVIVHKYADQNLRKLKKCEDADCTKCAFSEKTPLLDGGEGFLCKARLFDIKTLACFVPKE